MQNFFNMGKIVNTHGVKGEVKIYPYTDDLDKFAAYDFLYIEEEKTHIESARVHKQMVLVKFKGINTMNDAENLVNKLIYMPREAVDDGSEGHFIVDLIGCHIYLKTGEDIGVLEDVLQKTAQDLYVIKRHDNGRVFYLPVVNEFVKHIDIENRRIEVELIEGLME